MPGSRRPADKPAHSYLSSRPPFMYRPHRHIPLTPANARGGCLAGPRQVPETGAVQNSGLTFHYSPGRGAPTRRDRLPRPEPRRSREAGSASAPAIVAAVEQVEVAVVGAGLLGSATARALAARGVPVLLFEQFALGHAYGSSHGATRIFRYSYPDPCYVEMALRAGEAWARLTADAGEELLVRTGGLDAGPGAEDCAKALAECGVAHAWLTGEQVSERFGGIGAHPGERMLFQPDSGVSLAGRTVAALQRLARRDGAAVRAGTPVLDIEPSR